MRENRMDLVQAYDELLFESRIRSVAITADIIIRALDLQTKMISLKALDSLQLGSALAYHCDVFITNDKRLLQLN